jgi:2-oxoglutarate dehydrogenase E2 component (dihydrolipoamide succinyltransferase)
MNPNARDRRILVPDLGLDGVPIRVSVWLVRRGQRVAAGEPVVEILAGPATVDLSAPDDGVLAEKLVREDEAVEVGQAVGVIRPS